MSYVLCFMCYVCMCVCVYVCMCVCVYVCMCVCVYVCMYVYIVKLHQHFFQTNMGPHPNTCLSRCWPASYVSYAQLAQQESGNSGIRPEPILTCSMKRARVDLPNSAMVSSHKINLHNFKLRVSNPRTIAHLNLKSPFKGSNLPGSRARLSGLSF